MKSYIYYHLLVVVALFFSCQPSNSSSQKNMIKSFNPDRLPTGKVIAAVAIHNNTAHSYAIYLPKKAAANNRYNVLIFFDPHANAQPTIAQYRQLAERYSCILIASSNSQNGMDMNDTKAIAEELVDEAIDFYGADEDKIILCGFSGGAKVAINAAMELSNISRVVYCGATLPFQSCNHRLSLLGFAGKKDMNYSDVVSAGMMKTNNNVNNYCVEWDGKHEWPDSATFEQAFYFMNNDFLKLRLIKIDDAKMKMLETEQTMHQQYIADLQTKDESYWQAEINKLNTAKDETGLNKRLLGFISLMCYSVSNQMLHQGNILAAHKILNIYKLADPTNADCDYAFALMYAKMNQPDGVFMALNNAIKNGFKDVQKIKSESILSNYMMDKKMMDLVAQIKQ